MKNISCCSDETIWADEFFLWPNLGETNFPDWASDAMFDFLQWWDIVIDTETQFKFVLNQEFEDFNVKIIITNYKYLSTYVVLSER